MPQLSEEKEVLTVKVTKGLRRRLNHVCDIKGLQIGKFVELALIEMMENLEDDEWALRTFSERLHEEVLTLDEAFKGLKLRRT